MKLINALRIIKERERIKRKAEKEMQKGVFSSQFLKVSQEVSIGHKKLVHVQSIFPWEDVIALKEKTGEVHIKEAIAKAVYWYLQNGPDLNLRNPSVANNSDDILIIQKNREVRK